MTSEHDNGVECADLGARQTADWRRLLKVERGVAEVERQLMCLSHVPNEVGNSRIGRGDDEADRPILPPSNALGEREKKLLHCQGGEGDSRQIQNEDLRIIKKVELCSQIFASTSSDLTVLEDQNSHRLVIEGSED